MIEEINSLSEKLYQAYEQNYISQIVDVIEKAATKISEVSISEQDAAYFNTIVENILAAIEIEDWIFVADILRYELIGFIKEAASECL